MNNHMTRQYVRILMVCMVALVVVAACCANTHAVAEQESQEAGTYGLFTTISVDISGSNGVITGTAKNEFTLGYSTIPTYVRLYASETAQQSTASMTLMSEAYISDLDINKTLTTTCSTDGRQLYWVAEVCYKKDTSDWKTITTSCILFDANGNQLS